MNKETYVKNMNQEVLKETVDIDYTLSNVPVLARRSWHSIFIVLLGFTFLSTTMAAGATIGASFKFTDLLGILLIGNLILSVYTGLLSWISAKSGLNSVLLARYSLGKWGSKWADILLGGTQVIWYAVQTAYMGMVFSQGLGLEKYFIPITIFWGLVMGATAIKGSKGMEFIAYASIPAFLYLAYKLPMLSIQSVGGLKALFTIEPESVTMTFTTAVTMVIGTFISGGTNAPNWARFAKSPKSGFWSGFFAFFIGTFVMVISGMFGGIAIQVGDMIEIMIKMGIVAWAVIILIFNIWSTNTATAYAFGVAGAEFFNKPNKVPFVIGGVLIGTLMSVIGIYEVFVPFLIMLGVFIPPLGGLYIGDYLYTWRKGFPKIKDIEFKNMRYANLIAYLLSTLGAFISSKIQKGIPTVIGIILAVILVFIVNKIFEKLGISDFHEVASDSEYVL